MAGIFSDQRRVEAARHIFEHLARVVDLPFTLRLWDGTAIPLGRGASGERAIVIHGASVLGSLLRRPSLDTLFRHYVTGRIDLEGVDLIEAFAIARDVKKRSRVRVRDLRKGFPWRDALRLLLARAAPAAIGHEVEGAEAGRRHTGRSDKDLIQFHYDASNEFYALFLDREMVYSCAYFTDWSNSLEQAQRDKLDLICRKLRLEPDQRFLDIGCGWGALVCHAAANHGVRAHGVTLSKAQHDYARDKIARLGLAERVTVELRDYMTLEDSYDRIASVGMYEHVGIANYESYFKKMRQLLDSGGILLNHGITRRAKRNVTNFGKISASKAVILKYIFPGSELDHIGHTLQVMESAGLEVQDVEGLRRHYALTCRVWHDRLVARREAAIDFVGPVRYRMWLAYLAGVSGAFEQGPLHVFQTVATRQADVTATPLPPTRADIYERAAAEAPATARPRAVPA